MKKNNGFKGLHYSMSITMSILSARLSYQARKNTANDNAKVNAVRNLKHDLRWDGFGTYVRKYATSPFAFDECVDDTDWTMDRVISDILGDYDKLK